MSVDIIRWEYAHIVVEVSFFAHSFVGSEEVPHALTLLLEDGGSFLPRSNVLSFESVVAEES